MHQPYYKNIETNKFILPWVRMHAVKDYYDMAAILDGYPKIKQNFNLVPSLLLQIEEYIAGTTDIFMDMSLKKAADLNEDERVFIIYNFFMANWETMVFPYQRYSFLLKKRGENTNPDEIRKIHKLFAEDEMRDLQAWFNLTWIDPVFLKMFPELKKIKDKGENFNEDEKNYIIKSHIEIMKLIIPKYREMHEKGQIEISTTPFYHPILPLIYNTDIARQCMPKMPRLDFNFSHPEDADAQISKAVSYFIRKFGAAPTGMWPSEGSVSEEALGLIAKNGIKWVATDEEIIGESLHLSGQHSGKDMIYKPYVFNSVSGPVNMMFRNHYLSDLIGFSYAGWNCREAAAHFINELYKIKSSLDEKEHCVNVILDGENCWEYYPNDGKDFLNALYQALSDNPEFEVVTIKEALEKFPEKTQIKKIFPGSWINHDFYIWIGHEDDRKSWKLLKRVRDDLAAWEDSHRKETEKLDKAWESIYTAEGSDWNWWYGDDHSSKNDSEFDNLYRLHLMNVYRIIGEKVPDELYVPISKMDNAFEIAPVKFITPEIDGYDSNFYEWKGAGLYDLTKEGGAMHKAVKLVQKLMYGFDKENLYIRLDASEKFKDLKGLTVEIRLAEAGKAGSLKFHIDGRKMEFHNIDSYGIDFAAGDIFEAKIPFARLGHLTDTKEFKLLMFIIRDGQEVEKIPEKGVIMVQVPDEYFELYNWKV
jgi:alpha-amylase/alpha-mannosidase (GH57 family)